MIGHNHSRPSPPNSGAAMLRDPPAPTNAGQRFSIYSKGYWFESSRGSQKHGPPAILLGAFSLLGVEVVTEWSREALGTSAAARSAASRPTPSSRWLWMSLVRVIVE